MAPEPGKHIEVPGNVPRARGAIVVCVGGLVILAALWLFLWGPTLFFLGRLYDAYSAASSVDRFEFWLALLGITGLVTAISTVRPRRWIREAESIERTIEQLLLQEEEKVAETSARIAELNRRLPASVHEDAIMYRSRNMEPAIVDANAAAIFERCSVLIRQLSQHPKFDG